MISEQFNLSTSEGFNNAFREFSRLKEIGATIELKQVKQTRSSQQNRALHLFFTFCSESLNDAGFEFQYRGLKGMDIEIPWTPELFKEMVWKPIQVTLFDITSTTKITTAQINTILDVLIRHFAKLGLSVSFPNQWDLWLKQTQI